MSKLRESLGALEPLARVVSEDREFIYRIGCNDTGVAFITFKLKKDEFNGHWYEYDEGDTVVYTTYQNALIGLIKELQDGNTSGI